MTINKLGEIMNKMFREIDEIEKIIVRNSNDIDAMGVNIRNALEGIEKFGKSMNIQRPTYDFESISRLSNISENKEIWLNHLPVELKSNWESDAFVTINVTKEIYIDGSIEKDSIEYTWYEIMAQEYLNRGIKVKIKHGDGISENYHGRVFSNEFIQSTIKHIENKYCLKDINQ